MSDERRLKDEGEVPRGLLAALEAGQRDLPTDDEVRALEASVLAALAGGGGGGAAKAAAKATSGVQLGTAGVILATVAAVAVWSATRAPEAPVRSVVTVVAVVDAAVVDAAVVEAALDAPSDDARDGGADAGLDGGRARSRLDAGAAIEVAPVEVAPSDEAPEVLRTPEAVAVADEIALLRAARRALTTDPAEALAITERMASVPSPAWAEERERVAIEALDALGRDAEARARFERFVDHFPASAYRARLEQILATP